MKKMGLAMLATLALTSAGCFSSFFVKQDAKSELYVLPLPSSHWDVLDPGGADRAYRNREDQAILSVSSLCTEDRYRPLEELTEELIKQLPERSIVKPSRPIVVDGHPGLITEVRGLVDGGELAVCIAVFRTNHCVYDILLAGPSLQSSSRKAFALTLQEFHERPRR